MFRITGLSRGDQIKTFSLRECIFQIHVPYQTNRDIKSKICNLHILEKLDFLNNKKMKMKEDTRSALLREYVQDLKGMLPATYNEAWNHPDRRFRERWRIAIKKELKSLVDVRKVWRVVKRTSIPKGRRLVKSKWIFDLGLAQDCTNQCKFKEMCINLHKFA